jgi:hypothetical protein
MPEGQGPQEDQEWAPLFEMGALVLLVASIVLGALTGRVKGLTGARLVAEAGGGALLMLIAMGVALLFKAARNRRAIATVAFFTLLVVVLVHARTLATDGLRPASRRASILHQRAAKGWVVSHGVSFQAPRRWLATDPGSAETIATFLSPDSAEDNPQAMVTVQVLPTLYTDPEDAAQQWASTWGGDVVEAETDLDGVPALRVEAANESLQARPVEAVVALRGGAVYLIVGAAAADRTCWRQVEAIRRTWNWLDEF